MDDEPEVVTLSWVEIALAHRLDLWPTSNWESVKPRIDHYLDLADQIRADRGDATSRDGAPLSRNEGL